ncbi:membrane carboxypeptidase/penicillin-binding protein [Alistipes sp. CAG:268]|nr:membrane carboxypeptidase/penicillin-binding protein [Alistipes sp. CAG:268]
MTQPKKSGIGPKTIKWIWAIAFAPFVLLALMLALTALGVFGRMPSFEELENPRSNLATEVYSEDGKVIGTFFVQNRSHRHLLRAESLLRAVCRPLPGRLDAPHPPRRP